jgi:hypothetical protein
MLERQFHLGLALERAFSWQVVWQDRWPVIGIAKCG